MTSYQCRAWGVSLLIATALCCAALSMPEVEVLAVDVTGSGPQTSVSVGFRWRFPEGGALAVWLEASSDNGATWDQVPVLTLSGDTAVQGTTDWQQGLLQWTAGLDWPEQVSSQMRVRVAAEAEPPLDPNLYMVVDVSGGQDAAEYEVSYLGAAPPDLLTDPAYKTTHIVLRRVPAGTYLRGSPEGELGRDYNEAQHEVTLGSPFYAGVFEVTQAQYQMVTGLDPSEHKAASRPVEKVSWNHVRGGSWPGDPVGSGLPNEGTFIGRLRTKTGLPLDLPTEAQWEYACRAGTSTSLNSSQNITTIEALPCPNLDPLGRYYLNGGAESEHTEVAGHLPNAWGLYDMHGNVWEWCLDWSGDYPAGPASDPLGPPSGEFRVLRGGSWSNIPRHCRSATRAENYQNLRYDTQGLRLFCPAQ